jgi:hypothetical protein
MTKQFFRSTFLLIIVFTIVGCLATPAHPTTSFPLNWPVSPLSEEQIKEVRECNFQILVRERYPEEVTIDRLEAKYRPKNSCDWAVLALAYAERSGENDPSGYGINAFHQAISNNIGFAFATPIFYEYFDATSLVLSPQLSQQDIAEVDIQYKWGGLGDTVDYHVKITDANVSPNVEISSEIFSLNPAQKTDISKEVVQALSSSLDNLLPISSSSFDVNPCADNSADWKVQIDFQDGTSLKLSSSSNLVYIGGPWQTKIDGQNYVQYSSTFSLAIDEIWQELELIYGQPDAMFCSPEDVFSEAFGGDAISYIQPRTNTPPTVSPSAAETLIAEANTLVAEITESYTPTPFGTPDRQNWPFIETTDIPLTDWNSIPVMPGAIAGTNDGIGYIYTVESSSFDVYRYYLEQMPEFGWDLHRVTEIGGDYPKMVSANDANLEEFHPYLFYKQGIEAGNVSIFIHPDTGMTYVVLSRDNIQ